ncbi:MAG: hypothetical protein HC908_13155 [Calothrix sp. SM1_7_51]|nr:hypothetical protein [Calothrix sp. SM1_7_51]
MFSTSTASVAEYPTRADKFRAFDEATRIAYCEYLSLAWDVVNQLQAELGGELGNHATNIKRLSKLQMLNKFEIAAKGYRIFSYFQIRDAISLLFEHFGSDGKSNPGLISRSYQRKKAARQVNNATVTVYETETDSTDILF